MGSCAFVTEVSQYRVPWSCLSCRVVAEYQAASSLVSTEDSDTPSVRDQHALGILFDSGLVPYCVGHCRPRALTLALCRFCVLIAKKKIQRTEGRTVGRLGVASCLLF